MIEAVGVSKRYGSTVAVDDLTFSIAEGQVTGFLGPNGAGKSTTMRMMVGLDAPTAGRITIDGRQYQDLRFPLRKVGALLEAKAIHPGRSARNHLRWLADTNGIPRRRVDEVLEQVGLAAVARKRAGGFSLGMGQRLGIAAALLGEPEVLLLDEPVNGLDPEGILWVRHLLRSLAAEGRTVFVSSHLMNEMAVTAEHLIVIGKGKLIADCSTEEFIERSTEEVVVVRSPDAERLAAAIDEDGGKAELGDDGLLSVRVMEAARVGELAAAGGLVLHELTPKRGSLEEAFMELTRDSVEYGGGGTAPEPP
ncbi:MAG: type transport system ATP-binding protein, partial [Acidimicrobiaceae bacterium]|nr:type transport system ATP-binding protein [Acidimicrobiaceae bacterium]